MIKHRALRALPLLLACISLMPSAVLAQNFVPVATKTNLTTTVTQTQQGQTQVPADQGSHIQITEQSLNLPAFIGNTTILPTDTLMGNFERSNFRETASQNAKISYKFDDLSAFLKEEGWQGKIYTDSFKFNELNAIIEDSEFLNNELLGPLGRQEHPAELCSASDSKQVVIRINEKSKHLWIFTESKQFLSGKAVKDAIISGRPGTVLGHKSDVLTLNKGQLLLDSGKQGLKLACRAAAMRIPAESSSIVQYLPDQLVQIRVLHCPEDSRVRVRLSAQSDKTFELRSGEEMTVDISEENTEIGTAPSNASSFFKSMPEQISGVENYDRFLKHINSECANEKPRNQDKLSASAPVSLIGGDGSRFVATDDGQIALISGRLMLHNDSTQVLRTQMGDLYLQPDSTISAQRWQGEFRAQCCSKPKSAILVSEKFGVPMGWGTETLIVDHEPSWADAFPNDGIGRRRFEMHALKEGKCLISDFSMSAFLVKSPHCQLLRQRNEQLKDLRDELLKTAAALNVVTGYKGQYATQAPVTASANNRTN